MNANESAGAQAASQPGIAAPTIKGRLRLRPNGHILRARAILVSIPILVFGLAGSSAILSVIFHSDPGFVVQI